MMPSSEIYELAKEEGISQRTIENAKKQLNIFAKKIGDAWYRKLRQEQAYLYEKQRVWYIGMENKRNF